MVVAGFIMNFQFEIPGNQIEKLLREEIGKHFPELLAHIKGEWGKTLFNQNTEFDAKGTCYYLGSIKNGKLQPISRRTLTNFIKRTDNPLPYLMVGGRLRFNKTQLDTWRESESSFRKIPKIKTAMKLTPS
jgi:hypothetical protein